MHPAPETANVTAELAVPVTAAVNCCVPESETLAVAGEMLTATGTGTVTVALPDCVVLRSEERRVGKECRL